MPNTIRHKRGTTTPAAGSLVTGELAINTATGSVFTKTDAGTVVNVAASASASWGSISGTLSSQTDLNSALAGKANSAHTHAIADVTNLQTSLDAKANLAGATFTGAIVTAVPTASAAFLNLPHGTAPTTPNNGDVFTTTTGLFARINGSTLQYAAINASSLSFGGTTLSFGTSAAASTINVASGATTTGVTKTLNLATGALAGATTAVNIGSSAGTSTITLNGTVNAPGLVNGVKAWVNFNGVASGTWAGGTSTVTRAAASTTATVTTTTAHGLVVGNVVWALTGVTAGQYTVTAVGSATTFSFTTVESTALTAASITFAVSTIRASFNVSSITDNGVGDYTINFTTPMADTNYAIVSSNSATFGIAVGLHSSGVTVNTTPTLKTTTAARMVASYYDNGRYDVADIGVAFIR